MIIGLFVLYIFVCLYLVLYVQTAKLFNLGELVLNWFYDDVRGLYKITLLLYFSLLVLFQHIQLSE